MLKGMIRVGEGALDLLLKALALLGMADSTWMALRPATWSRFWTGVFAVIGRGGLPARLVALTQGTACLYLLTRLRRR
jgi:hypothetical protein